MLDSILLVVFARVCLDIVRSVWPDVTIPEVSIPEYVFREFDKHGKRPALVSATYK